MNCKLEKTIAEVAENTFAAMAFVLPVAEDEHVSDSHVALVTAVINFTGPFNGGLVLTVPTTMLPVLAANILGLTEGDAPTPEQDRDSLQELLNVICGNLLPEIASPREVFHVNEPHIVAAKKAVKMFVGSVPQAKVRLWLDCGHADLSLFIDQPVGVVSA